MPSVKNGRLYTCTIEVLEQMSAQSHGPQTPAKLRERIALAFPVFGGHEQQDAHEFFLEYVNQLHDEMLTAHAAVSWPAAKKVGACNSATL